MGGLGFEPLVLVEACKEYKGKPLAAKLLTVRTRRLPISPNSKHRHEVSLDKSLGRRGGWICKLVASAGLLAPGPKNKLR